MNKNKLIKTGVVAFGASALVFCAYLGYKKVKEEVERKRKEEILIEQMLLAKSIERGLKTSDKVIAERVEAMNEWMTEAFSVDEEQEQLDLMLESQQDPPVDEEYVEEEREVEEMRHDPNSVTALEQYKDMRMADIRDPKLKAQLRVLFEVPFEPNGEQDETIGMHIDDARAEFFGEGRWVGERTFADLLLEMARLLNFDLDWSIERAVKMMLHNLNIRPMDGLDTLVNIMDRVQDHAYETERGYGMFGLTVQPATFMEEYWSFTSPELDIEEAIEEDDE